MNKYVRCCVRAYRLKGFQQYRSCTCCCVVRPLSCIRSLSNQIHLTRNRKEGRKERRKEGKKEGRKEKGRREEEEEEKEEEEVEEEEEEKEEEEEEEKEEKEEEKVEEEEEYNLIITVCSDKAKDSNK